MAEGKTGREMAVRYFKEEQRYRSLFEVNQHEEKRSRLEMDERSKGEGEVRSGRFSPLSEAPAHVVAERRSHLSH